VGRTASFRPEVAFDRLGAFALRVAIGLGLAGNCPFAYLSCVPTSERSHFPCSYAEGEWNLLGGYGEHAAAVGGNRYAPSVRMGIALMRSGLADEVEAITAEPGDDFRAVSERKAR